MLADFFHKLQNLKAKVSSWCLPLPSPFNYQVRFSRFCKTITNSKVKIITCNFFLSFAQFIINLVSAADVNINATPHLNYLKFSCHMFVRLEISLVGWGGGGGVQNCHKFSQRRDGLQTLRTVVNHFLYVLINS